MAATQALVQSNTNDGTERAAPTTDGPLRRQRPWHHRRRGHAHGREGESPRRPATARRDTTSARSRSRAAGRGTTRCSRSSTPPATLYHRSASHTCSYLASVREAHAHLRVARLPQHALPALPLQEESRRRFLRHARSPDAFTVLGYGDWSTPSGTLHQAPLLRPQLRDHQGAATPGRQRRAAPVWEYKTSVLDSNTWTRMIQHEGHRGARQGPTDGPEEEVEDSQGDALPNQCWTPSDPPLSPRGTATSTFPGTSSAADDGDSRIRATKTVQANINASRSVRMHRLVPMPAAARRTRYPSERLFEEIMSPDRS
jgi:hypothetical protein